MIKIKDKYLSVTKLLSFLPSTGGAGSLAIGTIIPGGLKIIGNAGSNYSIGGSATRINAYATSLSSILFAIAFENTDNVAYVSYFSSGGGYILVNKTALNIFEIRDNLGNNIPFVIPPVANRIFFISIIIQNNILYAKITDTVTGISELQQLAINAGILAAPNLFTNINSSGTVAATRWLDVTLIKYKAFFP